MAVSKNERTKAARLRQRKTLTPPQRAWLAAYDKRVAPNKAKQTGAPLPPASAAPVSAAPPVVPVEAAHETAPLDDVIAPAASTWVPTVPPPAADGETGGAPDAPPEFAEPGLYDGPPPGAPLVEDAPAVAPVGDPHAAAQFRGLVVLLTRVGIASARELLADAPLPPVARALVDNETAHQELLDHVGEAAERVAVKYGFRSVPLADEAVLVAAVGGSALATATLYKRKLLGKASAPRAAAPGGAAEPAAPAVEMPAGLADVWG